MAKTKPRTMPGVMELLPLEQIAFQNLLDTVRRNFERYGFLPIETPAIEFADILLTKSGGETERQVFFVQKTGSVKQGADPDLALRFDLTVPLARYVAEHEHALSFPFRRYQIQRVYRGERQQTGRYCEFYQCDIDVIGKDALSVRYDAELPAVIHALFRELAIGPFVIEMNHRRLIRGVYEGLGLAEPERQMAVLREVDKLDKRGADAVRATISGADYGLDAATVDAVMEFSSMRSRSQAEAMAMLGALEEGRIGAVDRRLVANESLATGIAELREVLNRVREFGVPETHYALNFAISRGLDYYTGMVYETILTDAPGIGSICSGGRYDNLASNYTSSKLPGVGISIGATRLFYQLRKAGLLKAAASTVKAMVGLMDEADLGRNLALATQLRDAGIATEAVLDAKKLGKQFQYADRAGIRFVILEGSNERERGSVTVKDMKKGDQFEVARAELIKSLRVEIEQAAAMGEGTA